MAFFARIMQSAAQTRERQLWNPFVPPFVDQLNLSDNQVAAAMVFYASRPACGRQPAEGLPEVETPQKAKGLLCVESPSTGRRCEVSMWQTNLEAIPSLP